MAEPGARKDEMRMVHLNLPLDLQDAVEDFRFVHRFHSKRAVYEWLIRTALAAGKKPTREEVQEADRA